MSKKFFTQSIDKASCNLYLRLASKKNYTEIWFKGLFRFIHWGMDKFEVQNNFSQKFFAHKEEVMKKICTLILCAGMLLGAATGASAIDFKARGQWLMGFGVLDNKLVHKTRETVNGKDTKRTHLKDEFFADQRVRLYLDAVANENLSGSVGFEIGTQHWGQAESGAALGADGIKVKVKHAYIDWMLPEMPVKVRMGIQGIALPNAAGGSAIMDGDSAGITVNYEINENAGLTALWMRPLNDNYDGGGNSYRQNYLDNMDLFSLMVPLHFDGIEVTPWAMLGMRGKNALHGIRDIEGVHNGVPTSDGDLPYTLLPYNAIASGPDGDYTLTRLGGTGKAYGTLFWAGLPITVSLFDPLNIEFDFNYGYSEPMGRYNAERPYQNITKRSSTQREGWLAKALVEYKMDWGVPGIFGWYASGDDSNPKNGSERMPSIVPCGTFTSFLGDGNPGWPYNDYAYDFAGSWGIGVQLRDLSFLEDLSHTLRVMYMGGTNSPTMAKYMENSYTWVDGWNSGSSPYLTTTDGLLEFNFINTYKMYENLAVNLTFDYVANYIDNDTWKKAGNRNTSFSKQDAWKAAVSFEYSF